VCLLSWWMSTGCGFYQVTTPMLPVYLDAGFRWKLGEEAWVDRGTLMVARAASSGRRNQAERSGATLEFVPAEKVDKLIPQLERLNAWIEERGRDTLSLLVGDLSQPLRPGDHPSRGAHRGVRQPLDHGTEGGILHRSDAPPAGCAAGNDGSPAHRPHGARKGERYR
jgi:hypothetical protein